MKVNSTNNDDDNLSVTGNTGNVTISGGSIKRNMKNSSSNKQRVANVSKKLENVEYLIKIEQKNKKQIEEKYSKMINKYESQIEKCEKDLENTIKELNEKESKIFEIQKTKFDTFRHEIKKYENIYNELENKSKSVGCQINDSQIDENILYNHSNMIYEDYLSYNHEVITSKKKIDDLKENLNQVEKTYPKEFQFLLEDIQLEKEVNEMTIMKKQHQEEIEVLDKNKRQLLKVKELKTHEMMNYIDEIKKIEISLENSKNDNHLIKLEDYIVNNISDFMIFEKMKILVQNYYNQKNFDLENELNVILIKNLNEKLKEMKNEFVSIKNEKMMTKAKLEKIIEESVKLLNHSKNESDKLKFDKEIKTKTIELERFNNEINILELNCKKKETLFNKYIILLRNKCKKSAQESYYDMNPALIIETEFEEKFRDEIIKNIENNPNINGEEKIKNKNLIEIYFKEIINREKILQNCFLKKKKMEENIENLNKDIEKIEENLLICESEISLKKSKINELLLKERLFKEQIETRNRGLTCNLNDLGEIEFENYLKLNDDILKNMKKVYGKKVLDKVFKVQKQKFLEGVIMNHSFKKGKVNEYIQFITKSESIISFYNSVIIELENHYKQMLRKFDSLLNTKTTKLKEKELLDESKSDLKEKMEIILQSQIKEIELEKKQLQYKFNINYYIEKITDLNNKLTELTAEKEKTLKEYENFSTLLNEKEQKLYIEDLDLKSNLISLSLGVIQDNNPITVMPYKVSKSYDSNLKNEFSINDNQEKTQVNFQDMMKHSFHEYNLKSESINEGLIENDDEMKNTGISYKNLYRKDPMLSLTVDKIRPLVTGLSLYKKFNNNIMGGKTFDPANANENPPEACGYALRIFKINTTEETLEIRNQKNKIVEFKINLAQLKGIIISNSSKNLVKNKKNSVNKPNQDISKLITSIDYIPFVLTYTDGKIDLIAPGYQSFTVLESALEEILKNKKKLCGILKNYDINN